MTSARVERSVNTMISAWRDQGVYLNHSVSEEHAFKMDSNGKPIVLDDKQKKILNEVNFNQLIGIQSHFGPFIEVLTIEINSAKSTSSLNLAQELKITFNLNSTV